MTILRFIHTMLAHLYYRAAIHQISPMHPDVGFVAQRYAHYSSLRRSYLNGNP